MQPDSSIQKKIFQKDNYRIAFILLFGLAIFLLVFNIVLSFFTPKESQSITIESSTQEIDSLFQKSIAEFYLSDDYLKKIKSPKKKEDSLTAYYRLTLPYDIPIPVFLQSIFEKFSGKEVTISSIETLLNKKSILEISSGGKRKFYSELIQDTSLHRDNGSIAFALTDYDKLSEDEINNLLQLPESFAFLLQPRKESVDFSKRVLGARKEYIVELTASSPNSEFTLAEKFPFSRNKLAVNSLVKNYPRNTFYFVDPEATLLSSNAYEKVRKEFARRKYSLYSSNSFSNFSGMKDDELDLSFNSEIDKLGKGDTKVIILPANYFYSSREKLLLIKKRGIRIIPATSAVVELKEK